MTRRIDKLSPQQREILLKRLLQKKQAGKQIPRRPEGISPPLSHAQERLWFLDKLNPGNTFYNIPTVIPLTFAVNISLLKRVINEIVKRHESLRTCFILENGKPIQSISPELHIDLPLKDLTDLSEDMRKQQAEQLINEDFQTPFDITQGPLIRTSLIKLGPQSFYLALTMHHIISDGWSMGIFFRELSSLYNSLSIGKTPVLPELTIQYADYASWQRSWLDGEALDQQLNYWKERLQDTPLLQLSTDQERPAVQSFEGDHYPLQLSPTLTQQLIQLSEQQNVTLFMTLLAVFYTLLYRYTRQEDIAVGTYIANRNHSDIENLIGFFINTLVLRTDLSDSPCFLQLLSRVRQTTTEAFDHQDLPFPRLVEEIQPDRDLSRNPVFQVVLQLINTPNASFNDSNDDQWIPETDWHTAIFDLIFNFYRKGDRLIGDIEYSTDLFDASTIERMAQHFLSLAEAIVCNPEQQLLEFSMITSQERQQLIHTLNPTEVSLDDIPDILQQFKLIVDTRPDTTAFICENSYISYRQLASRVNALSRALKSAGVAHESLVAVCLERSFDAVAAILAVFAAGAAYLPMDPEYPQRRLEFMLQDSGASLLLTRKNTWKGTENIPILWIDNIADCEDAALDTETCSLSQLAYVIYTSGSTGKPKGVCVEHGQIINRLEWMWKHYPFQEKEVACHKTALSFVDSIWEILGAMLKGFPTVILTNNEVRDPLVLIDILAKYKVSRLWLVPPLLRSMLDNCADLQFRLPQLRFWVSSGEPLSTDLFQNFRRQMPNATLYNLYGTSETWDISWYEPEPDSENNRRIPIGRPIQNIRVYVLDETGQPVPLGVPGELYIAGAGLARGYLHRAGLNKEKFVSLPYIDIPETRLYRTGDLVRWCSDGNLEFIGRVDNQLKIRGIRIEPEEIEEVLMAHPGVDEAAVLMRDEDTANARLVAFIVQNPKYSGDQNTHDENWNTEKISQWRNVWDETYSRGERAEKETFNASGFISSYDGKAIPDKEVAEWVDQAVQKIFNHKPKRVLEIGCGTGLLLWKIAPSVNEYMATDFSPTAIHDLQSQTKARGDKFSHIQLKELAADEAADNKKNYYDTIIMHSVIQYFPGVDYLLQVIENALSQLSPNGVLYIGDVRDLNLLPAFYLSILRQSATAELTLSELRTQVHKRLAEEQELALDPVFFYSLKKYFPEIARIKIEPKRGKIHNEFTCFRYDVFIYTEQTESETVDVHWLDWQEGFQPKQLIAEYAQRNSPVGLHGVADSRSRFSLAATQLIEQEVEDETAFTENMQAWTADMAGIDPESWFTHCQDKNLTVDLRWSGPGRTACYDVILGLNGRNINDNLTVPDKPLHLYANNPLQGVFTARMAPLLKEYLRDILPEPLIPTSFSLLDQLPLTPSGKLDRKKLPVPTSEQRTQNRAFVQPSTPTQHKLAELYRDVLGITQIGIYDDFFKDLGGHSLLAAQLSARIHGTFNIDIPLRIFFESSTIVELEAVIEARGHEIDKPAQSQSPALVARSRESYRETNTQNPQEKG